MSFVRSSIRDKDKQKSRENGMNIENKVGEAM